MWRSLHLFKHICNIERATEAVDVSVYRDKIITNWTTIDFSVPCFFDPGSGSLIESGLFGRTLINTFTVFFEGDRDVRFGDRLKKGNTYYVVEDVKELMDFDFHLEATVRQMPYSSNL